MPVRWTVLILLLILVLLAGGFVWNFSLPPNTNVSELATHVVNDGEGVKQIAASLKTAGLIRSATLFRTLVWLRGSSSALKAGAYELAPNLSVLDAIRTLEAGGADDVPILLVEGWTSTQMATRLAQRDIVDLGAFLAAVALTDSRLLLPGKSYGFLAGKPLDQGLEGYLFPDTYRLVPNSTPAAVVEKLLDNFDQRVTDELRQGFAAQGLTVHEAVTLASIVELEVPGTADRRKVADIFLRRLEAGMQLEADSTVNFLTGKGLPAVTNQDLAIASPYNTYQHTGLPPGPIGNPGLDSLHAVANPEPHGYWYFLSGRDGVTHFAKTFDEHVANKNRYLR